MDYSMELEARMFRRLCEANEKGLGLFLCAAQTCEVALINEEAYTVPTRTAIDTE